MVLVGIDVGGTQIKAGLVTRDGRLISHIIENTKTKLGYKAVLEQMNEIILALAKENLVDVKDISAVGIGVPGTTSPDGVVYFANNLGWENKALVNDFGKLCQLPVFIENDASMAAMGELMVGSLKGVKNGILITLGTGLGSGILLDGKIFSGSHGIGRQAGHMKVGENFYECTCGANGCLETFASATALVKYYKHIKNKQQATKDIQVNTAEITAKEIMKLARLGDAIAEKSVERLIHYLGIGIANLINILDPEIISLGGGLAKAGDQLMIPLRESVYNQLYDKKRFFTRLSIAKLENDAGMIGSAMFACENNNK